MQAWQLLPLRRCLPEAQTDGRGGEETRPGSLVVKATASQHQGREVAGSIPSGVAQCGSPSGSSRSVATEPTRGTAQRWEGQR